MNANEFNYWLEGLTEPQLRALTHQSGLSGAMTSSPGELHKSLAFSQKARDIFAETYGH